MKREFEVENEEPFVGSHQKISRKLVHAAQTSISPLRTRSQGKPNPEFVKGYEPPAPVCGHGHCGRLAKVNFSYQAPEGTSGTPGLFGDYLKTENQGPLIFSLTFKVGVEERIRHFYAEPADDVRTLEAQIVQRGMQVLAVHKQQTANTSEGSLSPVSEKMILTDTMNIPKQKRKKHQGLPQSCRDTALGYLDEVENPTTPLRKMRQVLLAPKALKIPFNAPHLGQHSKGGNVVAGVNSADANSVRMISERLQDKLREKYGKVEVEAKAFKSFPSNSNSMIPNKMQDIIRFGFNGTPVELGFEFHPFFAGKPPEALWKKIMDYVEHHLDSLCTQNSNKLTL